LRFRWEGNELVDAGPGKDDVGGDNMSNLPVRLADTQEDYARLGIEPHDVAPFEDGMRTTGVPGDYEWWYFDAHLDDGAKLVVVFYTKSILGAFGPLAPMIRIDLDLPGGRSVEKMVNFDPGLFTAATDGCDVQIGDNAFTGDLHTYRIRAALEEIEVDVALVGEVPAWRPGTGHMYFGVGEEQKLFAWLPSVPQGAVTATYTVDGVTTRTTGTGYHDHNWGDAVMPELMHDWYWARGTVGGYTVIASYITAEERYGYTPVTIFMLAGDGTIITDDTSRVAFSTERVLTDETTGKPVADITRYDYRDGDDRYLVTFTRNRTILRTRFLDDMSADERAMAESIGFDGAYLRFTGPLTLRHETVGGPAAEDSEEAIWELMYFGRPRPPAT
jgi:hypothetical protein